MAVINIYAWSSNHINNFFTGYIINPGATMKVATSLSFVFLVIPLLIKRKFIKHLLFVGLFIQISQIIAYIFNLSPSGVFALSSYATILMFTLAYASIYFVWVVKKNLYFLITNCLLYLLSSFAIFYYLLDKESVTTVIGFSSLSWNTSILFFINSISLFEIALIENIKNYEFQILPLKKTHPYNYFPYFFLLPIIIIVSISIAIYFNIIFPNVGIFIIFLFLNLTILMSIFLYSSRFIDFFKEISDKSKALLKTNSQLKSVNNELGEKNNYLNDFASLTSHNLREPIIALKELYNLYKEYDTEELTLNFKDIEAMYLTNANNLNYGLNLLTNYHEFIKSLGKDKITKIKFSKNLENIILELDYLKPKSTIISYNLIANLKLPEVYIKNLLVNLLINSFMNKLNDTDLKINITTTHTKTFFNIVYTDNSGFLITNNTKQIKNKHQNYSLHFLNLYIKKLCGKIKILPQKTIGNIITIKLDYPCIKSQL
ncbi:phytochrome family protein [Neotamlana laminarinivorans]|uniref:Signal transduction histidine kinase n=1 Tax=Neotamlana laminarinivorans TaxID=2883124 RepID=A0A9X1I0D0_9FLAO|nr:hypothetical protein [Tamlana laminarinivorans]MCB4797852.1 hypothetical protein [Tamlana laminarinivorans]